MWSLAERWERGVGGTLAGVVAAHVPGYRGAPAAVEPSAIVGPAWVAEAPFAVKLPMRNVGAARRLMHAGRTVAWRLDPAEAWTGPFSHGDGVVIEGTPLASAADLLAVLEQMLFTDTLAAMGDGSDPIPAGVIALGNPDAVALHGAEIEPGTVLDVRKGAIVLEEGVRVRSGSRLEGPLAAAAGTWILGGQLRHVSAGPQCRLHGEISTSVFTGYSNKSHDGFVGHSVVGEWVNLGAGTITSNLKNTYGPIRLEIDGERVETGRTNLGALFGDHVKTAIGTLLPTGAVIGAGANLFGAVRAPKYVPPFAWGDGGELLGIDQFLAAARRIMPRRDVAVDPDTEAALRALHRRLAKRK
ncbi:MAG: hypothetical protein ACREL5_08360, partial [Gemmatimonadales bacterium]